MMSQGLTDVPTRAEWCRMKSRECEALAAAVMDRDITLDLREVAQKWLQLARLAEWLDQRAPDWAPLDRRHLH